MKDISQLHEWFQASQRSFPWREERTPYRVLVSEIMLQQTRASVVIPYFEKWMIHFPTLEHLAKASLKEVIKLWEGLGYYARARRLHAAAKQIVEQFGGKIPSTRKELLSIQGLGPYTVGALLSFAFRQRAPAVDGNVARLFSRYFLIEENIQKTSVKKKLHELAALYLDEKEPWVTAEAWIELGASICSKTSPKCQICPLQKGCLGYQTQKAPYLPITPPSETIKSLFRTVFLIQVEEKILLKKEENPKKVMADLYEFPFIEKSKEPKNLLQIGSKLPLEVSHTFTKYKAYLTSYHICFYSQDEALSFLEKSGIFDEFSYIWVEKNLLRELPFSSGHRKIMQIFLHKP